MGLQYYNINDVQSELSNDEQVEWLIKAFAHNPEVLQRAAQQSVQRTCANCGADDWRDAIVPDTLEICNRCGASR